MLAVCPPSTSIKLGLLIPDSCWQRKRAETGCHPRSSQASLDTENSSPTKVF